MGHRKHTKKKKRQKKAKARRKIETLLYRRLCDKKQEQGISPPPFERILYLHIDQEDVDRDILRYIQAERGTPKGIFIFAGAGDNYGYHCIGMPAQEAIKYVKPQNTPEGAPPDSLTGSNKPAVGPMETPEENEGRTDPELSEIPPPPTPPRQGSSDRIPSCPQESVPDGSAVRAAVRKEAPEGDSEAERAIREDQGSVRRDPRREQRRRERA